MTHWIAFALLSAIAASATGAQSSSASTIADSISQSRGITGSARVGFSASASRVDGGEFRIFSVQGSFMPFVSEHLQLGIAPGYSAITGARVRTIQNFGTAVVGNYVFGGGSVWRGYVGGFGAGNSGSVGTRFTELGAQAGALHFLDPAVVLRSELRYRAPASGPGAGIGTVMFLVTLDPHVFGPANAAAIHPAGFGVVDVAGYAYRAHRQSTHTTGAGGFFAPYLNSWVQIGVDGEAVRFSEFGGFGAHRFRGFGRIYVPASLRTQPFAEGFAETSTFGGDIGGLTSFGGKLGARRMLNSRIAVDVGLRRTLHPRRSRDFDDFLFTTRGPGSTDLVAGLAIRAGRAR